MAVPKISGQEEAEASRQVRKSARPLRILLSGLQRSAPLALLTVAVVLPFLVSDFRTFQLTIAISFMVAVAGLNLVTGYAGLISVATATFFGIGAYTVLVLHEHIGVSVYWGIPLGGIIAFVVGTAVGVPAARLRSWNLALLTIGVAVAFPPLLRRFREYSGGSTGLSMPRPEAPSWIGLNDDQWLYYVALATAVVLFFVYRSVIQRMSGRAVIAVRDNELAARSLGINASRTKVSVFALSALFGGVGGALFGLTTQHADPDAFGTLLGIQFLLGAVVGGLASIGGPILGGLLLEFGRPYAEQIFQKAIFLVYGIILILVMYLMPKGLVSAPSRLAEVASLAGRVLRQPGFGLRPTVSRLRALLRGARRSFRTPGGD